MQSPRQVRVGDVTIDVLDTQTVLTRVDHALCGEAPPMVLMSANLDHVRWFARGAPLPEGTWGGASWLTLLDGHPLVATTRRRLDGPVEAVPGSQLLAPVLTLAQQLKAGVALVGGDDETRRRWECILPHRLPGITVRTWGVRWADLDRPTYATELAGEVAAFGPGVLVVSLGKPRQELWLRSHFAATGARVALPVGSAVSYLVGTSTRPPDWTRRLGAEWAYRLVREPRRLARRYIIEGVPTWFRVRRTLTVERGDLRPGRAWFSARLGPWHPGDR